jgi:hypothetical protein
MGEELRFVSCVSPINGKLQTTEKQPKDWDNVRRLTNMLFLAWNDSNPLEGSVYLGEFYTPKPNPTEEFYKFFEQFNGFPINKMQKQAFKQRYSRNNIGTRDRQSGVSTFFMTLVAWEASVNNKQVIMASTTRDLSKMFQREYDNKCRNMGINPPPVDFMVADDRCDSNICGRTFDVCLYDCSRDRWQLDWFRETEYRAAHRGGYCLTLKTEEL